MPAAAGETEPSLNGHLDLGKLVVREAREQAHEFGNGHGADVLRIEDTGQEVRGAVLDLETSAADLRGAGDVGDYRDVVVAE